MGVRSCLLGSSFEPFGAPLDPHVGKLSRKPLRRSTFVLQQRPEPHTIGALISGPVGVFRLATFRRNTTATPEASYSHEQS